MRIAVLGPVRIVGDDGAEVPLPGRLQRLLLAGLLTAEGRRARLDALTELLWPGDTGAGVTRRVRVQIHRLRKVIGAARIESDADGYRLVLDGDHVDADALEAAVSGHGDLAAALAGWNGDPYAGLEQELFQRERLRLRELRLTGAVQLFQDRLDAGEGGELVPEIQRLLAEEPLSERLRAQLMLALTRAGRSGRAGEVFREGRRLLIDQIGVEPGAELQAAHRLALRSGVAAGSAPAELPPGATTLIGRDAQLAELDRLLPGGEGARTALISGPAGSGKTALALAWAQARRVEFPDGQVYVDLAGFSSAGPRSAESALAHLLTSLGVLPSAVPQRVPERSAMLRTLVASRQMLILLDDAVDGEQLRPLLVSAPGVVTVVTSRRELTSLAAGISARRVHLGPLPPRDAAALLARGTDGAGRQRSPAGHSIAEAPAPAFARLAALCGHLPLALRIAAERLREYGGSAEVAAADLVAELEDERLRLDALATPDEEGRGVRAVLRASYDALARDDAALFRRIGLLEHPSDLDTVAAAWGRDPHETRRALQTLVGLHLAERHIGNRVGQHDLLAAFARELLHQVDGPDIVGDSLRRIRSLWLWGVIDACRVLGLDVPLREGELPDPAFRTKAASFTDPAAAVTWLQDMWPALMSMAYRDETAGGFRTVLVAELSVYATMQGDAPAMRRLGERVRDDAAAGGDDRALALAECALGILMDHLGDLQASVRHQERALQLNRRLGDVREQAISLNNLSLVLRRIGRADDARAHLLQSLDLLGNGLAVRDPRDDRLIAACTANLASVELELGHGDTAATIAEALRLARACGDARSEGTALLVLALLELSHGRWDAASDAARLAVSLSRDSGLRRLEGAATEALAECAREKADLPAALDLHERALSIAQEVQNVQSRLDAMLGCGVTHQRMGDGAGAAVYLREVLALAEARGYAAHAARARRALDVERPMRAS
ncbi:BTAD domain-containing putative transcriptional regulator [Microbacterium sp. NPDC057659]|uniref:AfsR/SARP family transcriptional regulator n=1 Tax=Microbacterium sp. NPDC057659 TaxID=3346198 RepID=UPI0036721ACE